MFKFIKKNILIAFSLFTLVSHSQDSIKYKNHPHFYMPIKQYVKEFGTISKKDSLQFMFKDKDTLVLLSADKKPNSVSVQYEYRDSVFLNIYKEVVFNKSKQKKWSEKKLRMKYWKDDIKLFFDKSVSKDTKQELIKFTKELSKNVDSLTIYEVSKKEDSNYFIYEINEKNSYRYDEKVKGKDGVNYYVNWDGRQRLYKCTLEINSLILFNKTFLKNSVIQDFFKSLGQFYNTELLDCESIFSGCYKENNSYLTTLDLELLKYHYSFGINKGTDLLTFEEQHAKAKKELKEHNHKMNFIHIE
ncbi:MAG: hypothetical protein QM478_11195 [Flavobacteriaceae bacterium]